MTEAVEGHVTTEIVMLNPETVRGVSNMVTAAAFFFFLILFICKLLTLSHGKLCFVEISGIKLLERESPNLA